MVHLHNLSSSECFSDCLPWRFTSLSLVPQQALKDKAFRDAWINNPETTFNVYTLYEGVQGNARLRAGKASEEDGNPPLMLYGLAIDYDAAMSIDDVIRAMPNFGDCLPNWFEQTLSGNGRLIWLFEQPLRLASRKFALRVIERLHDLVPFRKMAGLDESALKAPERYFTNGCRWTCLSRRKISHARLQGFVLKISERFDWTQREFGKVIDLADVAAELKRKFPRFSEWPGDFELGAQGPSFWIDGSTSPKSAIIRETGIQTFSAHASKAFYSWAELVGNEFVENNENEKLGKAVAGVFHDGKNFIIKDGFGKYAFHSRENIRTLLMGTRGLKGGATRDGTLNEVDRAICFVMQYQSVVGAASCAFYPKELFTYQGRRILNTHQIEVLQPADGQAEWGAAGKFPFLSKFLDGFFDPVEPQRDRFLAWFQLHYRACLKREPRSGHGVFIAGPVGSGKTFLGRAVVGGCLGGYAEANNYLTASDSFNSELFDSGLWVIDDGSVASSQKVHQLFTENVKRSVANRDHRVNEKFRKAVMTPWQGRIFVTLNLDGDSVRLIPNVDASILEKLMLFRAGPRCVNFMEQPEMEALMSVELPHFLRWLLDWTPPAHCFEGAEVRFGVASYAEPSLLRSANLSSGKSVFVEMLSRWLTDYFKEVSPQAEYWEGTATELRIAMMSNPVFADMLRAYRPEELPRMLVNTMNRSLLRIEMTDSEEGRSFRIYKSSKVVPTPALPPQSEKSSFQKT